MDKQFHMSSDSIIKRSKMKFKETQISEGLERRLLSIAIQKALEAYSEFFERKTSLDASTLIDKYYCFKEKAKTMGLFTVGGIREKDHLNLFCLGHALSPDLYVESGVFMGGSLHAFSGSSPRRMIAIDPSLDHVKEEIRTLPNIETVSAKDFSELDFNANKEKSLVYFDDHINTAKRIMQASDKGFKYVLFDSSTGLEGITQRLYPAIPTIPMIMNSEAFEESDRIEWSYANQATSLTGLIKSLIRARSLRAELVITKELIAECVEARMLIKRCVALPSLADFIPEYNPNRRCKDGTKWLLEILSQ